MSNIYTPTIGLEVHAELATSSKMFCGCLNKPHGSEPNANTCPVCLAHPGTLPVPNKEAIKMVLQFGAAIGAEQATYSEFDRKNYFYPDIPKAYQISQYQYPFLTSGTVAGVELTRVHLEEDTARSSHEMIDGSVVDFNRAGVPLMELVTEPVVHSSKQAGGFARELQLLLQTLGISHANMERGEMRIEANISVSQTDELGTKVEVKNLNSFKSVEAAIEYEIKRHVAALESGEELVQETRGWDEQKNKTFTQRVKETAKDYRYFPDPDIPKIDTETIAEFSQDLLQESLPMLPEKKRDIYNDFYILSDSIETILSNESIDQYLQNVIEISSDPKIVTLAANYLTGDVLALTQDGWSLDGVECDQFVDLMSMLQDGSIGSRVAKDLLPKLPALSEPVRAYLESNDLLQISGHDEVLSLVRQIIAENPDQVAGYKEGKEALLKYLVGQGMKISKGRANPAVVEEMLQSEIAA